MKNDELLIITGTGRVNVSATIRKVYEDTYSKRGDFTASEIIRDIRQMLPKGKVRGMDSTSVNSALKGHIEDGQLVRCGPGEFSHDLSKALPPKEPEPESTEVPEEIVRDRRPVLHLYKENKSMYGFHVVDQEGETLMTNRMGSVTYAFDLGGEKPFTKGAHPIKERRPEKYREIEHGKDGWSVYWFATSKSNLRRGTRLCKLMKK